MRFRFTALLFLPIAAILITGFNSTQSQTKKPTSDSALSDPERDLINEINLARANPQTYAAYLEKLRPLFNGKQYMQSNGASLTTEEGWGAVDDAIKFLRVAKPSGPLAVSRGLCLAAGAHVKDQSKTGSTGHKGSDSSFLEDRLKPYGKWNGGVGENITYGNESARERLLTWLIDDGFPNRGHRTRLLSGDYGAAGISCGPHPEFGSMCVLTLAGGFTDIQPGATTATTTNVKPAATKAGSKSSNVNTKSRKL
jgi:uncharacterized protein YkwD